MPLPSILSPLSRAHQTNFFGQKNRPGFRSLLSKAPRYHETSEGWDFYQLSMILFHVDFPTVMTRELLITDLAVISGGEMGMRRFNVHPHVVHVPAPLSTQLTNYTITILLAVGLQVVVSVSQASRQFCWRVIPIGLWLYLCVEGQGVDDLGKSWLLVRSLISICAPIWKGNLQYHALLTRFWSQIK